MAATSQGKKRASGKKASASKVTKKKRSAKKATKKKATGGEGKAKKRARSAKKKAAKKVAGKKATGAKKRATSAAKTAANAGAKKRATGAAKTAANAGAKKRATSAAKTAANAGAKKAAAGEKVARRAAGKARGKKAAGRKKIGKTMAKANQAARGGSEKRASKRQALGAAPVAAAGAEPTVGADAPAFELPDQDGKFHGSEQLRGSRYVLYFYPKDNTPGCTTEACDFRDLRLTVPVFGVSPDSVGSHQRFASKLELGFPLLSDEELGLCKAYGVWKLKKNYGREYMGIERSTFLVDEHGKIEKSWRNVRVKGHAAAVQQALDE